MTGADQPISVSVAIVNWNQAALLAQCLESVGATSGDLAYEVIVIDNGSDDGSVNLVRERYPHVVLIANADNFGFGRAQNQAMAIARGAYILMLNNDATVRPETIATLLRFMERHPAVACCSCPAEHQVALGTAAAGAFRRFPSLRRTAAENLWALLRPPRHWDLRRVSSAVHRWLGEILPDAESVDVAWIVGALLLVRREALLQVGGFDEGFFLFDEDIDLCRRLRAGGWTVALVTGTRFFHHGGASSALRDDIERIRGDSRARYFRKYHGRLPAAFFRLQHVALRQYLLRWRRRWAQVASRSGARDNPTADVTARRDRRIRGFAMLRRQLQK